MSFIPIFRLSRHFITSHLFMSPNHFTFLIESALNKLEEKMIERWKKEGEDYRKVRKKWRSDGQGSFAQTGVLNVFSRVNCGMRKKWGKSAKF